MRTLNSPLQDKNTILIVNGYNSTHGGGLRIFKGLVGFLANTPKNQLSVVPEVWFSPRHEQSLVDEARESGLRTLIYRPTGFQLLDQIILYFIHLPIRSLFTRHSEYLLNFGDYIVPFYKKQIYYFDWLYAAINAGDVWKQMTLSQRITRGIKRANIRALIKTPKVVVVQSNYVATQVQKVLGRTKLKIIPCPVEIFSTAKRSSETVESTDLRQSNQFLCLSSFATHKNVEILLGVAKIIKSRGLAARILLTLDETDDGVKAFKKRIIQNELEDFILNVGTLNFKEVETWFERCDALLLPTKLETFGLPYVESLARDRPILTSDLPFAREICTTGTIFFDPDDPLDIANKIEIFIKGGGLIIDKDAVKKIIERCRPERIYCEIISQTLL